MSSYNVEGRAGRKIIERVLIKGTLVLETPTHLGNGDAEALTDMPLLLDEVTGKPLLTGTSIAGALRAYVREVEHGYGVEEQANDRARQLFGSVRGSESMQSWILVDDALGEATGVEIRDGVAIDPATRTAEDRKKYDIELLQVGTTFEVSLELLLSEDNRGADLLQSLALALHGLQEGEIGLGMRKHRGLGQCRVTGWRVRRYKVTTSQGLLAWLDDDASGERKGKEIYDLLGIAAELSDNRESFALDAAFGLESSLLIRSSSGVPDAPDMVHLQSYRAGENVPVLSGTSLAGAIRARARRIANTLLPEAQAKALVNGMFGRDIESADDKPTGSRVITYETRVQGNLNLVQSRVKIDRFTGGAYPQALFSQQPLFGGPESEVQIHLELRSPKPAEIGLLLLVLKDLWTGDLPLGGERSVGRGRLTGHTATLAHRQSNHITTWELSQDEEGTLHFDGDGTAQALEAFVEAFHAYKEGQDA
jgi:CRISPR/Cas system CSM-associated protein Csm3 (group 7 of RAMP superfamily)